MQPQVLLLTPRASTALNDGGRHCPGVPSPVRAAGQQEKRTSNSLYGNHRSRIGAGRAEVLDVRERLTAQGPRRLAGWPRAEHDVPRDHRGNGTHELREMHAE